MRCFPEDDKYLAPYQRPTKMVDFFRGRIPLPPDTPNVATGIRNVHLHPGTTAPNHARCERMASYSKLTGHLKTCPEGNRLLAAATAAHSHHASKSLSHFPLHRTAVSPHSFSFPPRSSSTTSHEANPPPTRFTSRPLISSGSRIVVQRIVLRAIAPIELGGL